MAITSFTSQVQYTIYVRAKTIRTMQQQVEMLKSDLNCVDPVLQDARRIHREYKTAKSQLEQLVSRQRYDKWALKQLQRHCK